MRRLLLAIAGLCWATVALAQSQLPPAIPQIRNNPAGARVAQGFPAVDPANLRPPRISDNSATGNNVGDIWLDQTTGKTWIAYSTDVASPETPTTKLGLWVPYLSGPIRPFDGQTTSLKALFGTRRLLTSYVGLALRLKRTSDSATQDISFLQDDTIDAGTADAFCAADPVSCFVTIWYDQSGNGYDAANTTAAVGADSAPMWDRQKSLNGQRVVSWESNKHDISASGGPPIYAQFLTIPAAMSWSPTASSWLMVGIQNNSKNIGENYNLLSTPDETVGWVQSSNAKGVTAIGIGGDVITAIPTSPSAFLLTSSSTGTNGFWHTYLNNEHDFSFHPTDVGVKIGAVIGNGSTAGGAIMHLTAFAIWNTALSVTTAQPAVIAQAEHAFNIQRQNDDLIIVLGPSDNTGQSGITGDSWPMLVLPSLIPGAILYNNATGGIDTAAQITRFQTLAADQYTSARGATKRNVVFVFTTSSVDIQNGASLASIQANYVTMAGLLRGLGSNVRIVMATRTSLCPWLNHPEAIVNQGFNDWIRTGWNSATGLGGAAGLADAVADTASNTQIDNGTYTTPGKMCLAAVSWDGIHNRSDYPNNEYQQTMVPIFAKAINAVRR